MDLSLASAHSHLQTLVDRLAVSPGNPTLVTDANNLGPLLHDIVSTSTSVIPDGLLQSLACLVSLTNLPQVSTSFCQVVVAAWTRKLLFPIFESAVSTNDISMPYALPKWWPCQLDASGDGVANTIVPVGNVSCNAPNVANATHCNGAANPPIASAYVHSYSSFWDFVVCLGEEASLQALTELARLAVVVLNAIAAISRPNPLSQPHMPYKSLVNILSTSAPHRDMVMVVVFQMPKIYAQLRDAPTKSDSKVIARCVDLLQGMFIARAAWTTVSLHLLQLSEAAEVQKAYTKEQINALQLAATSPFRLIVDMLNQGRSLKLHRKSIIVPCIHVVAAKLEQWSGSSANKVEMYDDFNRHCHTQNLIAVLCEFGFLVSQIMLSWSGQDMLIVVPINEIFVPKALPPIAKPDYFLVNAEFSCQDETVDMIQTVDAYADLMLGVTLVMKTLLNVIDDELAATKETAAPPEIAKKLIMKAIEQIYGLLVAATSCCLRFEKLASQGDLPSTPPLISVLCGLVVERIIIFAEKEPFIWITLFNFANDACYADMRLVEVFEELIDGILSKTNITSNLELVECGILLFVTTFSTDVKDRPGISKYSNADPTNMENVEVDSSEYRLIYATQQIKKNTSEGDNIRHLPTTASSVASSRQRANNKFGK